MRVLRERVMTAGSNIPTAAILFIKRESPAEMMITQKTSIFSDVPPSLVSSRLIRLGKPVWCSPSEMIDIPIRVITGELLKPEKSSAGFTNPARPIATRTARAKKSGLNLSVMIRKATRTVMIRVRMAGALMD